MSDNNLAIISVTLSILATIISSVNFYENRFKYDVYFADTIEKVKAVKYFNHIKEEIEIQNLNKKNIFHLYCNVFNNSNSPLHIHNIQFFNQNGIQIKKYRTDLLIIESPINIIVDYKEEKIGMGTFEYNTKTTKDIPAKSTAQINALLILPPNTTKVTFRISTGKQSFVNKFIKKNKPKADLKYYSPEETYFMEDKLF